MRAALAAGFGLGTPSAAEGPYAQRARISALGSAEKYAQAIPLAKAMLANLDKGPPTKDLAGALNNLTQLYSEVDRDAEASRGSNVHLSSWRGCPVLSLSIARSSSTILPHSVSVTSAMPEPLLKRALALSERSLVANHPAIGRALTNLATTYEKPGRALAIREAAVGPDHPDTASVGKQSRLALPGRRLRCRAACGADDIPCTLDPEIAERAR